MRQGFVVFLVISLLAKLKIEKDQKTEEEADSGIEWLSKNQESAEKTKND